MGYRIEDGKGSRSRAAVFEGRTRTLAVESSLMAHISAEANETDASPIEGVFDIRAFSSVAGSGGSLIYMVNNDPDNFVVIDRMYTNAIVSNAALPDASTYISIIMGSAFTAGTGTPLKSFNTNQSIIDVQPQITLLNSATTSGGVENSRRYVNISRVYFQEPVIQKVDGIILGAGSTFELFLATLSSTTVEVDMRFAMTSPDDLGFKQGKL